MRSLIAAGMIVLAGSAWAANSTDKSATAEQKAQATYGNTAGITTNPNVPPEFAKWSGSTFYPNEFCYKIYNVDRNFPQYWDIRRWCDKQERRGSGDFF